MDLQARILLARRALLPRPLQGHVQVRLKSVLAESRRATAGLALGTRCLRSNADAHATHSSTSGHVDSAPTRLPLAPRDALRKAFARPRLEAFSCWSPPLSTSCSSLSYGPRMGGAKQSARLAVSIAGRREEAAGAELLPSTGPSESTLTEAHRCRAGPGHEVMDSRWCDRRRATIASFRASATIWRFEQVRWDNVVT